VRRKSSPQRLKTDRLDCYLHWRGSIAVETVGLEELVGAGKIRSLGVSNFDADLDEMLDVAGEGKIACNQVPLYHLERAIEHAVIRGATHGTAVVLFASSATMIFRNRAASPAKCAGHRQVAWRIATPTLAFLARQSSVFAIPKASSQQHAADNAAAGEISLGSDDIAALDKAFPRGARPRSLPML
jgi:diketogulonate reductase-like aldo/keto reductase